MIGIVGTDHTFLSSSFLIVFSCSIVPSERWLEPRNGWEFVGHGLGMQGFKFPAAMQGREYLAGIKQLVFVERHFDAFLVLHVITGEHFAHQITFFDPDPMFSRQNTADLNT